MAKYKTFNLLLRGQSKRNPRESDQAAIINEAAVGMHLGTKPIQVRSRAAVITSNSCLYKWEIIHSKRSMEGTMALSKALTTTICISRESLRCSLYRNWRRRMEAWKYSDRYMTRLPNSEEVLWIKELHHLLRRELHIREQMKSLFILIMKMRIAF